MPVAVLPPKRVLGDSTKVHRNANNLPSPSAAKRRKLDVVSSPAPAKIKVPNGAKPGLGSSQPKSQFEEEVLEKLTQDINGLKQKNSEKDQQWDRPNLDAFDEKRDSLCFQQIEVEEGTLHGGKTTVKLFGVNEVGSCCQSQQYTGFSYASHRTEIQYSSMLLTFYITSMLLPLCPLRNPTAKTSSSTSRHKWHKTNQP